ncbi:uncharacterized protein A4U43_C03F23620 [Asparagus officinalis]|uniref:Uncharacterized protein n=1 Tax=Asparagus officinalis TaxID=4686 RepID=A0A5P1FCF7_ASPOF|nr:uncharacterized protein A4U43_C03F23620 [Asparagus officinalis]
MVEVEPASVPNDVGRGGSNSTLTFISKRYTLPYNILVNGKCPTSYLSISHLASNRCVVAIQYSRRSSQELLTEYKELQYKEEIERDTHP